MKFSGSPSTMKFSSSRSSEIARHNFVLTGKRILAIVVSVLYSLSVQYIVYTVEWKREISTLSTCVDSTDETYRIYIGIFLQVRVVDSSMSPRVETVESTRTPENSKMNSVDEFLFVCSLFLFAVVCCF